LRGEASDADRIFVQEQCAGWGIACHVRSVKPKAAMGDGRSLQMAARDLRREALLSTADAQGIEVIATAHHADDALETLLLNMLRGAGLKGWGGIPPRSGRFIRPLIGVERERITTLAHEEGIPFREDASNRDPKYLRNRVRHELLPAMEALRPGAIAAARRSVPLLRALVAVAEDTLKSEFNQGSIAEGPIPIRSILDHAHPLLALTWLLRDQGLHPAMIERLLIALEEGHHGGRFIAASGTIIIERTELVLVPPEDPPAPLVIEGPDSLPSAPLRISAGEAVDLSEGADVAWLDADAVPFPWILRRWQAGDRIHPIGTVGSKLVSDLLTDAKVDHAVRAHALVLESEGRLIWLLGGRVDEKAAAKPGSRSIWRVEFLQPNS
jgi:tRNA(Ile)-lysidine synthase